jgi:predicted TIM-barrel fold metal-dependent hydrolase
MKSTPNFGEVEVLDAHGHFFSRRFFEALAAQSPDLSAAADPLARIGEVTGWDMPPADPAALGAAWRRELDAHGVRAAMLMASVPGDEESIAAAVAACPGRIVGAFMLDPTREGAGERARRAFDELGLRVACLFPAMHHFSPAECEGAHEVAALAGARQGTAVFVHCGALSVGVRKKLGLPSRFDLRRGNPLDVHPLAAEFPRASFVIPHFGAGMFREALMLADLCPNVYLDTSSSNRWVAYEPAPLDLHTVFERALAVVGHRRLLFGTDSSFFPRGWHAAVFEAQAAALGEAGADAEQARAIFGGNLRDLVGLEAVS